MQPKVSIVVPIYNMEGYLTRCLDSLITQSFVDIEIIAVNDGSTDSSLSILHEYAKADCRVVVINKNNGGVSSARNEGIQAARGAYIGFVDPDDWVDEDMYGAMYKAATDDHADIIMCTYVREFGSHSKEKKFDLPTKVMYGRDEVQSKIMRRLVGPLKEELASPEYLDAWGTVWSKLYRSELIKNNDVQFVDLSIVGSNEDSLFNIHAFYNAHSFVFLNQAYYHYWRANSESVTSGYNPSLIQNFSQLYQLIDDFLIKNSLHEDYHSALNNRICFNTLGLGLNTISKYNNSSMLMKMKTLNKLLNDGRMKRCLQQLELTYFPATWKVFFLCAKLRFSLGLYVMLVTIEWLRKNKR